MPSIEKKPVDNFFQSVYDVVKLVPKGRVTTYGAIASFLGTKSSSRMVGWAMNNSSKDVPAHRVVNRTGMLTGKHHFKTPDLMEKRLRREGIAVSGDRVKNFPEVFWDPSRELL